MSFSTSSITTKTATSISSYTSAATNSSVAVSTSNTTTTSSSSSYVPDSLELLFAEDPLANFSAKEKEVYQNYYKTFTNSPEELFAYYKKIECDVKNIKDEAIKKAFQDAVSRHERHKVNPLCARSYEDLALITILLPKTKILSIKIHGGYRGLTLPVPSDLQEVHLFKPKSSGTSSSTSSSSEVTLVGADAIQKMVLCRCFKSSSKPGSLKINIPQSVQLIKFECCSKCVSKTIVLSQEKINGFKQIKAGLFQKVSKS